MNRIMAFKILLFLTLSLVPCLAGRDKFADDRFSLEFPDDWKKPAEVPEPSPLLLRENKAGTALFAVNSLPVPENLKADLDGTAKAIAETYKKDFKMEKAVEADEGEIDGLPARFLTIIPPKPGEDEEAEAAPLAAYFLVLVDTRKEVLILQATLALPTTKELREQALAIIMSFKRED